MWRSKVLLLDGVLHFLDCVFASLFLRNLGVLRAAVLREAANEREITALQLTRCKLLGSDCGLTASALRTSARGTSIGRRSRRCCGRSGSATGTGRTSRRTTGAARRTSGRTTGAGRAARRAAGTTAHRRRGGTAG